MSSFRIESGVTVTRVRLCTAAALMVWASTVALSARGAEYRLQGTVTDMSGAVQGEATVWLNQHRYVRKTVTDAAGRFDFGEVPAGPIELCTYKDGFAVGGSEGHLVEDTDAVMVMDAPETIRLHIVDKSFEPIEGAYVGSLFVSDRFHIQVSDLGAYGFPSARSDSDGVLEIGYVPQHGGVSPTVGHGEFARATLPALPAGASLDMPLSFGVKVRGRVVDEMGRGVEHTRVSVFRVRAGRQQEFAEPISDREGFYSAVVPPEEYYVAARHRDYGMPGPVRVLVDADGGNTVPDITLPAPRILRGTVVTGEGVAVPRARVVYLRDGVVYAEMLSDVSGNYEFVVATGAGHLRVVPPPRMIRAAAGDVAIDVGAVGETVVSPIRLNRLPEIRGKVSTEEGTDLDKVLITTMNVHPPRWTVAAADGSFEIPLTTSPRNGRIRLRAEHGLRFLRGEMEVDVAKDESVELELHSFEPDLSPAPEATRNQLHHMVGKAAPEIECDVWLKVGEDTDAASAPFLRNLAGKVVVLTLWGGFDTAGPGRARIEEMKALDRLFRDVNDVAIISVHDAGLEPPDIADFVEVYAVEFPVCCDKDPFLTFDLYNTNVIPQTVLIDKQGILRYFDLDGRLLELIKDLRRRN